MTGLLQKKNIKIGVAAVSLFCVFCILRFAIFAPATYGVSFSAADAVALSVRTGNTFRQIALWTAEDGSRGYFFLPAYAETGKCCFLYEDNLELVIDGRSVRSGQYLDDISLEKPYILSLTSGGEEPVKMEVIFLRSENLPAVYIDTESGSLDYVHEDKANREAAEMEIVDESGRIEYLDSLAYIKGHGNSTWDEDKKPYYIKLKEAKPLLGMESGNKWILFANAGDASLLRNWTAYHLAEEAGIEYTSKTRFIDLYINGVYLGNYQLVEKIDIGTEHININNLEKANNESNEEGYQDNPRFGADDEEIKGIKDMTDPEDITGGYLLERNYGSRYRNRASGFITEGNEPFVVRSPAYASREEMAYIYNFTQAVENSILAEDGIDAATGLYYADLIDAESFVKKYLLEEIVLNEAQGATSSWFYKPENTRSAKLYAGPPWDYDKSMANHEIYMNPRVLTKLSCYVYNGLTTKWFGALCRKEEFWDAVREDYQECFRPALESLLDGELAECALQIRRSAYMDSVRWQTEDAERRDFASEAERLESWLKQRREFLDEVWLEGREYCLIWCLEEDRDTTCYIDSVRKGDILPELPAILSDDGRLPLYWYDAEKDMICEPGCEVTQDLKLVPVY